MNRIIRLRLWLKIKNPLRSDVESADRLMTDIEDFSPAHGCISSKSYRRFEWCASLHSVDDRTLSSSIFTAAWHRIVGQTAPTPVKTVAVTENGELLRNKPLRYPFKGTVQLPT